jgi:hypothetical protein
MIRLAINGLVVVRVGVHPPGDRYVGVRRVDCGGLIAAAFFSPVLPRLVSASRAAPAAAGSVARIADGESRTGGAGLCAGGFRDARVGGSCEDGSCEGGGLAAPGVAGMCEGPGMGLPGVAGVWVVG